MAELQEKNSNLENQISTLKVNISLGSPVFYCLCFFPLFFYLYILFIYLWVFLWCFFVVFVVCLFFWGVGLIVTSYLIIRTLIFTFFSFYTCWKCHCPSGRIVQRKACVDFIWNNFQASRHYEYLRVREILQGLKLTFVAEPIAVLKVVVKSSCSLLLLFIIELCW